MNSYEARAPKYFATPPVNLIRAYRQSLLEITGTAVSLEQRFALHKETKDRFQAVITKLGLRELPQDRSVASNAMSAVCAFRSVLCT